MRTCGPRFASRATAHNPKSSSKYVDRPGFSNSILHGWVLGRGTASTNAVLASSGVIPNRRGPTRTHGTKSQSVLSAATDSSSIPESSFLVHRSSRHDPRRRAGSSGGPAAAKTTAAGSPRRRGSTWSTRAPKAEVFLLGSPGRRAHHVRLRVRQLPGDVLFDDGDFLRDVCSPQTGVGAFGRRRWQR